MNLAIIDGLGGPGARTTTYKVVAKATNAERKETAAGNGSSGCFDFSERIIFRP
jgi:hypothetical protein